MAGHPLNKLDVRLLTQNSAERNLGDAGFRLIFLRNHK